MNQRAFPRFDENTAPLPARDALARARQSFGAVPEPLARYASSPLMLETALAGLDAFENRTSLTALEREVLAMTMGHANDCKFCLNLHRRLLRAQQAPDHVVAALESGEPLPEPRLEALRKFVLALLQRRGDVSDQVWTDFRRGGYSHEQALEVLTGVSIYTLTTLANRLTESSD